MKINKGNVFVRSIPYPYQAMMSICSDLDETPTKAVYLESSRYLNTSENTIMGRGVNLEVGNTIYFDMPKGQFSYWNTDDVGRKSVRELIRSGHIDCIHSFGDLAVNRAQAVLALDELVKHDCFIKVWIDHAIAPTNLDGDIMRGYGDLPGNKAYHADVTLKYGINYVWKGRVTSVIGQSVPRRLNGIWNTAQPMSSFKTLIKEYVKGINLPLVFKKYDMHGLNRIMKKSVLRNGSKVWEFMRCNPHWGGISSCETAEGIAEVLNEKYLETLVSKKGKSILYTHLGKINAEKEPFDRNTRNAFELLSKYSNKKKVLVATTRRLLDYEALIESIEIDFFEKNNLIEIVIRNVSGEQQLDGLSLYVSGEKTIKLIMNDRELTGFEVLNSDIVGKKILVFPWKKLVYPI